MCGPKQSFLPQNSTEVILKNSAYIYSKLWSDSGCVDLPFLFSSFICVNVSSICESESPSTIKYVNLLPVRFADDTTMLGQVTGGDESAYKEEVQKLTECCTENSFFLNTKKTK